MTAAATPVLMRRWRSRTRLVREDVEAVEGGVVARAGRVLGAGDTDLHGVGPGRQRRAGPDDAGRVAGWGVVVDGRLRAVVERDGDHLLVDVADGVQGDGGAGG